METLIPWPVWVVAMFLSSDQLFQKSHVET